MRFDAQITRTQATVNNLGNAISYSQTRDGYLQKIGKALDRMSELAVLAQDATKTDTDRALYNKEFGALNTYINNAVTKDFNGVSLFSSTALDVTADADGGTLQLAGITTNYFVAPPPPPAPQFNGDINSNVSSVINGDINGNINGNVNAAINGKVNGNINGNVNAPITGNVTGNINGNVSSDITGDITGNINGNVSGNITGNITGNVNGNVHGTITGNVSGTIFGNVAGTINGNISGSINGNVSGNIDGTVGGGVNGVTSGTVTGVSHVSNASGNSQSSAGDISTVSGAASALTMVKSAIDKLATDRATVGASVARLNATTEHLGTLKDNLSAANSRIKDLDVAEESTHFAQGTILVQAGTAMLAQANTAPNAVLRLLS